MNPIKIEQLLHISTPEKVEASSIKLQPERLYAGVLLTDPVQGARLLQLSTSQGLLQIRLPASVTGNNGSQLQASFSQQPDGRVQVVIQAKGDAVQSYPLNQQQALTLALNWARSTQLSVQQPSSASQIPVELTIGDVQTQIRLPQGSQFTLPPALHTTLQSLQVQYPAARILASITLGTGQEPTLFIEIKAASVVAPSMKTSLPHTSATIVTPAPLSKTTSQSTAKVIDTVTQPSTNSSAKAASLTTITQQLTLPIQLQQSILLRLADSVLLKALPARLQQQQLQLGSLVMPLPQSRLPTGSYQIQLQTDKHNWQLQLQSTQKTDHKLTVSTESFNRPFQLIQQDSPTTTPIGSQHKITIAEAQQQQLQQAWRNLIPLLSDTPSRLAAMPELPAPIQQVLQLLRQSQPSAQHVLTTQQLQHQLQAMLQFAPMVATPQVTNSAAGTLAVAIQLLLGKLSQRSVPAQQQTANQRLVQLIQSMEPGNASTLLRQLASHSGAMQQAQLASAEVQHLPQFVLQLPLQQDQGTAFSQLRIEQKEDDSASGTDKQKVWQLTMRFDLNDYGDLLAIARLQDAELKLHLYTDKATTQHLATRLLPLLTDRLRSQGIDVLEAECQLGKIPDSLLPRRSSLIATQA